MSKTQNETIKKTMIPDEVLINKIYLVRNQKVMLDTDLAELYGVKTFRLNERVKRNIDRFPEDFMFQLTEGEWESLTSQIAMSKKGRGGRRTLPYDVFLRVEQVEKQMIKQDQKIELLFGYLSKFIEKEGKPRKRIGYEIGGEK